MTHKVALVTGGSKRIGRAICARLHRENHNIIIHYHHSKADAEALAAELNAIRSDSACALSADFSNWQSCEELAKAALAWQGHVDVLINNASSFYPTPLGDVTQTQWQDVMGSNAMAPMILSQLLAESIRQQKGSIINIIDAMVERPSAEYLVYNMAKAALLNLTRMLALQLAPDARCNAVSPGSILWPDNVSEEQINRKRSNIPLKHEGRPEDIVNLICYLLADDCYINGQNIAVDGGRSLN